MFVVVELQEVLPIYFTAPLPPIFLHQKSHAIRSKAKDNIRYGNCVLVLQYTKMLLKNVHILP